MTKTNLQALLDMIRVCESQGGICMDEWFVSGSRHTHTCGTVGCLVGTYLHHKPDVLPEIESEMNVNMNWTLVADHFGVSVLVFKWLFTCVSKYTRYRDLKTVTKDQALSRLRKYVYYKLRQQEMDDSWNNRCPKKNDTVECQQLVLQETV